MALKDEPQYPLIVEGMEATINTTSQIIVINNCPDVPDDA